jgi:hypothetical protein
MKECLEITGSVANFSGGVMLLVDALRVLRGIKERSGGDTFHKALEKAKIRDVPRDEVGRLLDTAVARELELAMGPLKRSWVGFAFLVLGFGCEIASHLAK